MFGGQAGQRDGGTRRYYGKYAGIVIDNAAQDGDHRGRLRVRVPGILEETPDGSADRPIEVVAAPSFLPGFFFIPEPETQVWVEFVAGDINHPIWTGVWYPADVTPKSVDGEAPTEKQKVIRTASGQVIQLDDTAGSEQLVVRDEKNDSRITLDQAGITIEHGQNKVLLEQDTMRLEGAGCKITMSSSGVVIEMGTNAINIKSDSITAKTATAGEQSIVLKPLIDWLLTHMHIGNMGAPTPLDPGSIAALNAQLGAGLLTTKLGG